MQAVADAGFKAIICNRPDGEGPDQPGFQEIENAAKQLKRQSQLVCKENLANVRLEKKLKKEEKKNVKHSRTTKKSI